MSINKIAQHLNVSKSTVSLVINGKAEQGRISTALAKRIMDYVEEIGYKPNALAKSLATGKSQTIGLIVENIGDSFFGPIALRIEEYIRKLGMYVIYSSTLGDDKVAANIINNMLDKHVDGIIIAPTSHIKNEIMEIITRKVPLVIFDRKLGFVDSNYVGTNNYEASQQAIEHLYINSFETIGVVTIESDQPQMKERLNAYIDFTKTKNKVSKICKVHFSDKKQIRIKAIEHFLNENPDLDALYFTTNYLCVEGIKAIKNLRLIKKIGLISFDDHELFELMNPTISCIEQPLEDIAKSIVKLLKHQLKQKNTDIDEIIIPSTLKIRESSKK